MIIQTVQDEISPVGENAAMAGQPHSSQCWCPHWPDGSKLLSAWWTLAQVTSVIVIRHTKHLHVSIVIVSIAPVFIEAI